MTDHAKKNLGSIQGALMALTYGLVAVNINHLLLSEIPLYKPFPGRMIAILLITLCGAIVGGLAAWSTNNIRDLVISAVTGAVLSTMISYFIIASGANNLVSAWRILFFNILPRGVLILGPCWLIQRVIKIWEKELQTIHFSATRMVLPILGLMVIAMPFGFFSIYPINGQTVLEKTNDLLVSGLSTSDYTQLPTVLLPVDGFLERAKGRYTLQLSNNPRAMPIELPIYTEGNVGYTVFVRFENGFRFGCVYIETNPEPACAEY